MKKEKISSYISLAVLILLIFVPAAIVYWDAFLQGIFNSWSLSFYNLGKIFGLLGLATFSFSLLLASRFSWLDKLFYGLPRALNIHRWLGVVSFTLIIMHPLLLAGNLFLISPELAFGLFLNWTNDEYLYAYIALLIFMGLILMTFFWRLRYERLKNLHSLMAVPLMLGGIHALLIDSDVKQTAMLGSYYIVLISASVAAYLLRLYLVKYGLKAKPFIVKNISYPSLKTVEVTLSPAKGKFMAQAGQFVFVSFSGLQKKEEHPFSVASISEDKNTFSLIAKSLGDFTNEMRNIEVGQKAMVDGPYGRFGHIYCQDSNQVWIAGGIGITPFLSMAQAYVKDKNQKQKVNLIYVVSSAQDLVAIEFLKKIEQECPRFKVTTYDSRQEGYFDLEKLKDLVPDFSACHYSICGPKGMTKYFVDYLKKARISSEKINIEAFKLL